MYYAVFIIMENANKQSISPTPRKLPLPEKCGTAYMVVLQARL
jgi:hypothetical protein